MSRFRIGQKVVCVKTHSENLVIKGKIYTVLNTNCPCNCNAVDVGIVDDSPYGIFKAVKCYQCNSIYSYGKIWWISSKLFAPLQDDGSRLALVATVEQEALEELKLEEIEMN